MYNYILHVISGSSWISLKPIYAYMDTWGHTIIYDIKCMMLLIHHPVSWALQYIFFLYSQMMGVWTFKCTSGTN